MDDRPVTDPRTARYAIQSSGVCVSGPGLRQRLLTCPFVPNPTDVRYAAIAFASRPLPLASTCQGGVRPKLKDFVMSSPDSRSQAEGNAAAELAQLRANVDSIDSALLQILVVRFNITRQVSELKAKHSLPASDPRREAEHLRDLHELAAANGLQPSVLDPIFSLIYGRVVRSHEDVASSRQIDTQTAAR